MHEINKKVFLLTYIQKVVFVIISRSKHFTVKIHIERQSQTQTYQKREKNKLNRVKYVVYYLLSGIRINFEAHDK